MYSPPSLLTLIYVIVATSVVVNIDRLANVENVVADIGDRLSRIEPAIQGIADRSLPHILLL